MVSPVEPWSLEASDPLGLQIIDKFGWKQAFPIDRALDYSYVSVKQSTGGIIFDPTNLRSDHCFQLSHLPHNALATAQNKCLDKVREEAGQASSLAVAWLQRGQAISQMESGLNTILRIVRAVKRRDPRIVRAVINRHPDREALIKSPSGLWLGYWFGIVPTVSDIHHAAGVLAQPFPAQSVSASSGFSWERVSGTGYAQYNSRYMCKSVVKLSAQITAVNSDIALLDRLGFTSPLGVALELVPWSWALNYVVNIQQLARNLEPSFPGIEIGLACTSQVHKWNGTYVYQGYDGTYIVANDIEGVTFNRYASWPRYEPVATLFDNLSTKRISYLATAIAMGLKGLK